MSALVSVHRDGAAAARLALERCIAAGGVALFPADGLYGLACDPLDRAAIARIQAIKGREHAKPCAVMYFSVAAMREALAGLGPQSAGALGALLPGPLTLVLANPLRRYPLACGGDRGRLGVRLIGGPLAGAMCPVLQTSANRSGEPAPSRFTDVSAAIVDAVEIAIDGGDLSGLPSTVIDLSHLDEDGGWEILREGAVGAGELGARIATLAGR